MPPFGDGVHVQIVASVSPPLNGYSYANLSWSKGGVREPFDREKLLRSMQIALRKRAVDIESLENTVNGIVRVLETRGESEVLVSEIGEKVMAALKKLDSVAYGDLPLSIVILMR